MKKFASILFLFFSMLFLGCPAQKGKAPVFRFYQVYTNVIVVLIDDQGYGDISSHGNPYLSTPNMDALHDESVRLTDFHVDPTCSPTRAALMTGRYSSRVGVWLTYGGRNHLRKDEVTLAEAFQNTGYKTAIFGKWHLGDNYPFRPRDRGFEESLIHGGGVAGETPDYWNNDYYDDTYFRNGEPEMVEGYCTDVWFREAGDFIERNREKPFFVYLSTNAPHGPFNVPVEYAQSYLDAGIPEKRSRFYGMIRNIDDNLGGLRKRLEELELAENTLILFMTDNGTSTGVELTSGRNGFLVDGYNAGMRGKKGSAYEGGHRAACFIHWPKGNLVAAGDLPHLTAHVDVMPTLVDLCNLKLPRKVKFDGTSLAPLLRGDSDGWPQRTLVVHDQSRFGGGVGDGPLIKYKDFSVLTDQWRLVGKELYDIHADPGQNLDIADEHPKVVKELSSAYESWWSKVSENSDTFCPFIIDGSRQKVCTLSAQNLQGDAVPYNQQHVRTGMQANGYWVIDVVKSGSYEIALRRWPREVDAAISTKVEMGPYTPDRHDANSSLYAGETKSIPAKSARLKVGDYDQTLAVSSYDKEVRFSVYLTEGEQKLQTWFQTDSGETWAAYYVYIQAL